MSWRMAVFVKVNECDGRKNGKRHCERKPLERRRDLTRVFLDCC